MPFLVDDIRKAQPQDGYKYLFDTNVWLAVLDPIFNDQYYAPYVNFFNGIINDNKSKAKIAMPGLLLSEIINRMLNDIYYKEFCISNPCPVDKNKSWHYKKIYRVSSNYKSDLDDVCASIRDYHAKIEFVSDNLFKYSCKQLIKNIPLHLDINDYLFCKMALEQNLIIVTNDADFIIEDIHILTARKELLRLT